MRVLVGTSGWSYAPWKGIFYPAKMKAAEMLPFYASRLPAVELNASFYRIPKVSDFAAWAAAVPEDFRFAVKAPMKVTHQHRLKDAGEPLGVFLEHSAALGVKRGPILFGLPPNLKVDVPRLTAFLATLPAGVDVAFEFRHESWLADDVYAALRAHGAALCVAEAEGLVVPMVETARFGYLRLRMVDYDAAALDSWAERVVACGWEEAFVFFKHEDAGTGPRLAKDFAERLRARGVDARAT